MLPNRFIVIVEFTYKSKGADRYLPNDVRRLLMGQRVTGRRGLPEEVKDRFGDYILLPDKFSLIKRPVKIGGRTFNAARGAVAIYMLTVPEEEIINEICKMVIEKCLRYGNVEIIVGQEMLRRVK